MNNYRKSSVNVLLSLVVALMAVVAVCVPSPAVAAEPAPAPDMVLVAERRVSESDDGQGLVLGLLEGDRVEVRGDVVLIVGVDGVPVARIDAQLPEGYRVHYDARAHRLDVVSNSAFRARRCWNNKWVSWAITGLGDAMVCVPLTAGVSGMTAGIGAAAAAAACHMGASALGTAVKC